MTDLDTLSRHDEPVADTGASGGPRADLTCDLYDGLRSPLGHTTDDGLHSLAGGDPALPRAALQVLMDLPDTRSIKTLANTSQRVPKVRDYQG